MPLGEVRVDRLQQVVLFPGLQHDGGPLFTRDGAQFPARILGGDGLVQFALDGQVKPFLRASLEFEAHA